MNALELCNCCDAEKAAPASAAGYCTDCEQAGRAGRTCEHDRDVVRVVLADGTASDLGYGLVMQQGTISSDADRERHAQIGLAVPAALMDPRKTQMLAPGDRVMLVYTDDPYTALEPGDVGTVDAVSDVGTEITVDWDTGPRLTMLSEAGDWIAQVDTEGQT